MACVSCNKSGPCSGSRSELRSLRNQIVTLHNTIKDYEKKQEYLVIVAEVDEVSRDPNVCPDKALLYSLENYIANERNERSK